MPARMNKLAAFSGLAAACFLSGCLEPPKGGKSADTGIIYRHHFVGANALPLGTNATKLKEVIARPSTKKMGAELAKKLARAPREYWTKQLPKKATSGAEFIEPLLADLFVFESYLEVRGSMARPELVLAVQLPDDRANAWDKSLKDLVSAWQLGKPADVAFEAHKGWEIKRRDFPNKVQYLRAGKWVLVSFGSDQLALATEALQALDKTGAPTKALPANALLDFEADFPRLAPTLPALATRHLPPARLTMFGRGEFVRTEAQFRYGRSLNWKFEPWRIPTNMIPDTINSFTAAQGIAPFLNSMPAVTESGLKPLPNQICMWGVSDLHGHVFAAIPVKDATNTIHKLASTAPKAVLKHWPNVMGNFLWASNRAEILWQGLPFVVPYLYPLNRADTDYLFFGMLPRMQTSNPPPAELFAQLGDRKDLAYYDWEVTGQRLIQARQLYGLANLINKRLVPDSKSPGDQWLQDLDEVLGPSVTEIAVKSQNELHLVRKSHIGFTGFELATFSIWLESPRFPLGFEPRPRRDLSLPNTVPKKGSSNAAPAAPRPSQ